MILTLILCALLSAATLFWVLSPAPTRRIYLCLSFAAALSALAIYLVYGRPDLEGNPARIGKGAEADYRQLIQDEFTLLNRLSENQNDADALIRLAIVRLAQGRTDEETLRLIARAETIAPDDIRLKKLKSLIDIP